jgi:hypothetical protein
MDKLLWFNDDISYLFRANIVEYDMQTASLAVSERYKLIDPVRLEQLRNMPKDQRTREVGLMQRSDKEFSDAMINGIIQTRTEFLQQNHIDENDVLCLHSDAVIFHMKSPIIDKVDNVTFAHKHTWSSYLRYNGIEIYYHDQCIDYKGIPREMLKCHTLGINRYLSQYFRMMEECDDSIIRFMSKFQSQYLKDQLPPYYYTPFGKRGEYKMDNLRLFAFLANVVLEDMHDW